MANLNTICHSVSYKLPVSSIKTCTPENLEILTIRHALMNTLDPEPSMNPSIQFKKLHGPLGSQEEVLFDFLVIFNSDKSSEVSEQFPGLKLAPRRLEIATFTYKKLRIRNCAFECQFESPFEGHVRAIRGWI